MGTGQREFGSRSKTGCLVDFPKQQILETRAGNRSASWLAGSRTSEDLWMPESRRKKSGKEGSSWGWGNPGRTLGLKEIVANT